MQLDGGVVVTSISQLNALRDRFEGVADYLSRELSTCSPRFVTLVAKWSRDDLVPGLSDMDFRIVCDEKTTAEDWVHIDDQIGRIHRRMVEAHPEWNRINEHTAGAGVSLAEFAGDRLHHPEYAVWTPWRGKADPIEAISSAALSRPLEALDEHYHLSRFLAYYSPYIKDIDPPINLGELEPKYALHSRCWHYYAPPMLSAATLLARRHFAGKRDGLLWLAENGFAAPQTLAVLEQVDAHYDTPERDDPQRLAKFEGYLFTAFEELLGPTLEAVKLLPIPPGASRRELQAHLSRRSADPLIELLEHVRFARIRAGRYYFYLHAPAHFSASRQLAGEQIWTRKLVLRTFSLLDGADRGEETPIVDRLQSLSVEPSRQELEAVDFMSSLAGEQAGGQALRDLYADAISWYPDFYRLIERTLQQALKHSASIKPHADVLTRQRSSAATAGNGSPHQRALE